MVQSHSFGLTGAYAVCKFFFYSLATPCQSVCVAADMATATDVAVLPDAPITPCEVPPPALSSMDTASTTKESSKDHLDRDVHDVFVPETREKNAIASTGTADAVNGGADGSFTHDPVPLTDEHRDSGYSSGANEIFDDIWSPATKLKRRLEHTKDLIICPGVYDGFSARIALSVGFDAMYMVGLLYSSVSWTVERQIGADGLLDGCRNNCFEIGHGGSGRSKPHGYEGACRYDSKFRS